MGGGDRLPPPHPGSRAGAEILGVEHEDDALVPLCLVGQAEDPACALGGPAGDEHRLGGRHVSPGPPHLVGARVEVEPGPPPGRGR
jgi:hypothetical protein